MFKIYVTEKQKIQFHAHCIYSISKAERTSKHLVVINTITKPHTY